GFLVSGTSYSGKGLDKKDDSKGGSDIWLIRLNEFGDELWQKTLGTSSDEEAKAVIQTTDLGFFVAGNIQNSSKGYGSKDVWITRLDKDGKELSQLILGGRGLDEVEKMIPTKDGGALLGIYSRSSEVGNPETKPSTERPASSIAISQMPKASSNFGEGDYWIVKLDKNGKVEWEKNFGGKGDDHIRTLALTSNGFIIGGESRSERSGNKSVGIEEGTDLWLISLNERGDEQWQKSYNFKN
ncbi:T9SS C-terminal target domain-containing protein, partial [Chryseobacterium sp. KMC2]|nr:T9SS C-terminal target domain-containing protein [Chryseobacterium sp. KMC2]